MLPLQILGGCTRFRHDQHEQVFVAARQVYLHDRVAAVSNRVGMVSNGDALQVLDRGHRFVRVQTAKGEVGWLEDHAIIDEKLHDQFEDLEKQHAQDPVVATAQLRDDLYLHILPGRDTPHFLLVPGSAKVQLLERGTVAKTPAPGMSYTAKPKTLPKPAGDLAKAPGNAGKAPGTTGKTPASKTPFNKPSPQPAAPPVVTEDWWLVRGAQGGTGWLLGSRLDLEIPDEIGGFAEGQRMVGAYPIAKVTDYGGGRERKGEEKNAKKLTPSKRPARASHADKQPDAEPDSDQGKSSEKKEVTEYLTVLTALQGGLPFDFDQVRVFTWSLNHHRYETGYRLHGIRGYLPVRISQETVSGQVEPVFSFQIANGPDVKVDPETGVTRPASPRTVSFRLEGNMVKRTGADMGPIVLTHEDSAGNRAEAKKAKPGAKAKKRH